MKIKTGMQRILWLSRRWNWFCCLVSFWLLGLGQVLAHQFWIEPSAYFVKKGEEVKVFLKVGDGFPGEDFSRYPTHLRRFEAWIQGDRFSVPGRWFQSPAGIVPAFKPGLMVLAYESEWSEVELKASVFQHYIELEGLNWVVEGRMKQGWNLQDVHEKFRRYSKCLLQVDDIEEGEFPVVGHELEIVLKGSPKNWKVGNPIAGEILKNTLPMKEGKVRWFHESRLGEGFGEADLSSDLGFVFVPPKSGRWMLSFVDLEPGLEERDWSSLWANLTFEVQD